MNDVADAALRTALKNRDSLKILEEQRETAARQIQSIQSDLDYHRQRYHALQLRPEIFQLEKRVESVELQLFEVQSEVFTPISEPEKIMSDRMFKDLDPDTWVVCTKDLEDRLKALEGDVECIYVYINQRFEEFQMLVKDHDQLDGRLKALEDRIEKDVWDCLQEHAESLTQLTERVGRNEKCMLRCRNFDLTSLPLAPEPEQDEEDDDPLAARVLDLEEVIDDQRATIKRLEEENTVAVEHAKMKVEEHHTEATVMLKKAVDAIAFLRSGSRTLIEIEINQFLKRMKGGEEDGGVQCSSDVAEPRSVDNDSSHTAALEEFHDMEISDEAWPIERLIGLRDTPGPSDSKRMEEIRKRLEEKTGTGWAWTEQWPSDVSFLISEIERLREALRLGGHLRRDGSVCDYIATGTVCNKCGTTDTAFPIVMKLMKEKQALKEAGWRTLARLSTERTELRAALEEIRDDEPSNAEDREDRWGTCARYQAIAAEALEDKP